MSEQALKALNISDNVNGAAIGGQWLRPEGKSRVATSPIDRRELATVKECAAADVEKVIDAAHDAYKKWRVVPGPKRGEFVRRVGEKLRQHKSDLARIVQLEAGKITQEALGEVQEMIDICDFAVGLSRQLYGLTIASERPGHRMMEQWHPLGAVGVITAFNFPVAVWAWNAALAWVCGDAVVWKPSDKTTLCAIAVQNIVADVLKEMPEVPPGIMGLTVGDRHAVGEPMTHSPKLPLISATGSVRMGREIAQVVGKRLGCTLLELGGNNGLILAPSADLDLATRAIVFASVGTCGQRCTSLRRLIVHESLKDEMMRRLTTIYSRLKIGDPSKEGVLVGPLIDEQAAKNMDHAIELAKQQGGKIHGGGRISKGVPAGGAYVRPAIVEITHQAPITCEETFAPILYVMTYKDFDNAIEIHNAVPQGLSSAVFTSDVREAELFMSPAGSDCGIANVNIGTSGAEIGGAFGGEKETGGGRESGSDSWKVYMRRTTNTINYSKDLPLAQGISFDVAP